MKDSTQISLVCKRDNLQKMLMLQREIIAQNIGSGPQQDLDKFPRSHTIRFFYGARGLLLAQMIFKQVIRHHPRTLGVIKNLGQLLLKSSASKINQ